MAQTVPQPAPRRTRVWDLVATIILLVPLPILAIATAISAPFVALVSDSCGIVADCSTGLVTTGVILAFVLPIGVIVVGIVLAIIALVRRRLAFWIPLVTAALAVGAWFLGFYIAASGVPGFFEPIAA